MTQKSFPVTEDFLAAANTSAEQYQTDYQQSIESPESNNAFWAQRAELVDWIKNPPKSATSTMIWTIFASNGLKTVSSMSLSTVSIVI